MCKKDTSLTVVIPAYNESKGLPIFLPSLLDHSRQKKWKVIVVNDGSIDNTREVLEAFAKDGSFIVIHHKLNKGYGAALKTGMKAVDTELVITVDADGQHIPDDIDRLLEMMINSEADMIIGSREGQRSVSWFRSLGKWLIRRIAKILLPVPVYDINSGMKIYRTKLAKKYISICPDSMAFSDIITLLFISRKHLVKEVPINIRERMAGESTIGIQTAFDTVLEIVNIVMLFNPLKIFLPISIVLWVIGIIVTLPPIFRGRGVSVAGSMIIILGMMIMLLGLIAEQLSAMRKDRLR